MFCCMTALLKQWMQSLYRSSILGKLPEHFYMNYLSASGGIINCPQDVKGVDGTTGGKCRGDILPIPGGKGAKAPDPARNRTR